MPSCLQPEFYDRLERRPSEQHYRLNNIDLKLSQEFLQALDDDNLTIKQIQDVIL